jgi:integrase
MRSLRTSVKATAIERAKLILEELRSSEGGWAKFEVLKVKKDFALCSEVEAAYKAWAPGERPLYHVRLVNLQKLKQVVRVALGEAQDRDWSTVVLSADLVRQYQAKVVRAAIDAEDDVGTAKRTANSTLTQARSVFAHLEAFSKLKLPEMAAFMAAPRLKLAESEKLAPFLPFTQAEVDRLHVEMVRRREAGETGVWLTYLLMLHCGMRNEEVQHCKREWFDVRADGSVWVRIVHWPYYFPKASLGEVPVPAHVWAEVQRLVAADPAAWVIPGATATDREEVCKRRINAAVQAALPERTAYDLRKMAGSNYYLQTGRLMEVAKFLRHKSSKTSEQWYVSLIDQLKPLGEIRGR